MAPISSPFTAGAWSHEDESYNFVWANQATSTVYTPSSNYAHSAAGGLTQVTREDVGRYRVRWYGSILSEDGVAPQVSAYGSGSEYCKVHEAIAAASQDELVVACYDDTGNPVDTRFSAIVVGPHIRPTSYAFAHANQPSAPSYLVSGWSGIERSDIEITRTAAGIYRVDFPDFSNFATTGGNLQVTAYGANSRRCTVVSWGADYTNVRCFESSGNEADTEFGVFFQRAGTRNDSFAYAFAHDSAAATYTPSAAFAYNAAGGAITATRSGTGVYAIEFDGLASLGVNGGNVQVTAYTSADKRCKVSGWSDDTAQVRCFDTVGAPVDSVYSLIFRKPIRRLVTSNFAIAEVRGTGTPTWTALSWNPYSQAPYPAGQFNVTRPATGLYQVEFPNMEKVGADGGNVQVGAIGEDGNYCKVEDWWIDTVTVRCFDPAGAPINEHFFVLWMKPEATNSEIAYAWFEEPSLPSHFPDLEYAHNPAGGSIETTRTGIGQYRVRFLGIDSIGRNDGAPMVTAYGNGSERCQISGWNLDFVTVNCHLAGSSTPVDSRFSLLWLKLEEDATGFAYAMADLPTSTTSYAPPAAKTHPFGANVIMPHAQVGASTVIFNGIADTAVADWFPEMAVLISSVGTAGEYCGFDGPGPEDWFHSACWDATGTVMDARFVAIGIVPIPLPEPGSGLALLAGHAALVGLHRRRRRRVS